MKKKYNSRGKISHDKHTETVIVCKGIAIDANQKVTKTIVKPTVKSKRGRTLGDMVYEFIH